MGELRNADGRPGGSEQITDWGRMQSATVAGVARPRDERELQDVVREAASQNLKVSVRGVGHSAGGQSFRAGGVMIDMRQLNRVIHFDESRRTIQVQSGASWGTLVGTLEPCRLAISTTQEFQIFTIGGSLAANIHGKSVDFGPLIETVDSFRLLQSGGDVVNVSRDENPELFRLAIGGYGLFGVVTDVTFRLVEDRVVRKSAIVRMPMDNLIADYLERVRRQPVLPLCYGFLDPLCREGYYLAYEYDDAAREMPLDQLPRDEISHLAFNCFAGVQRLSSWVRKKSFGLMWATSAKPETTLRSRRLLLWDQPPRAFQDMLLQKYFVPCQNFARFAQRAGEILGSYQSDLPLMTNHFRYVPGNADACLSFAPQDAICLIPCYLAKKDSPRWRARLAECTARLLDAAIELGGSYYLTFDILATPEQFHRAYPAARRFFELKRHYDPAGMFSSCFHEKYGTDPNGGTAA